MLNKEKSKKSSSEDNKAVTFRVKTDIAEKIRQIAKKRGKSQGAFISELVEQVEKQGAITNKGVTEDLQKPANEVNAKKIPIENFECTFFLSKRNDFAPEQNKESMKYICRGHWLYYPSTLFSDPVDYYEKALRRDFKIKADVNLKYYELQHVVNLFEKESDGRISSYIAGETLILQKRYTLGTNICLFPAVTVYRCHPVADFQDIIKYFGRYLNAQNRFDLDFLLAKQITKIDDINAYFY